MALGNNADLLFRFKADGSQAKAEARETAAAVRASLLQAESQFHKDFRAYATSFEGLKKHLVDFTEESKKARKATDELGDSARRAGGRGGSIGQFIEAFGEGDIGEILGEVAQSGGPAGTAIAALALSAVGAGIAITGFVAAMAKMTGTMIENVRETDLLTKNHRLAASQIQALQVISNLTGESVEDLAENYKKLGPEIKKFEQLVKDSGVAIDKDLREKVNDAAFAWEAFKLTATAALNEIARSALPQVTATLKVLNDELKTFKSEWGGVGEISGKVLAGIAAGAIAAGRQIRYMIDSLRAAKNLDLKGVIENSIKAGSFSSFSADFFETYNRIQAEAAKLTGSKGVTTPSTTDKSSGGRKDISDAELEVRRLRVQQQEAMRLYNDTAEAAERLTRITLQLHEAERRLAEQEKLPNQRAARLEEIQAKEREALDNYNKLLGEIRDNQLKPIEELSKKINKENQETAEWIAKQEEAARKLYATLREIDLDRRESELDNQRRQTDLSARAGSLRGAGLISEQAAQEIAAADLRLDRRKEARDRLLEQIEREIEDEQLRLQAQREINRAFEEEELRHALDVEEIRRQAREAIERENPLSTRSLFGDRFADLLKLHEGNVFPALAQSATEAFKRMSAEAGNFGTIAGGALGQFTEGLGQMAAAFFITGETGPAALRKLTAAVLANIAQQAAIKSVFELAAGFASLFWNPAEAAAHFTAAGLYAAVAAGAGFAARAVAPATEEGGGEFRSSSGQGERRTRTFVQDSKLGFGPVLEEVKDSIASGDASVTGAVSGVGTGVNKGNSYLGLITEHVARIRENTDLMIERTADARNPFNRLLNLIAPSALFRFPGFDSGGFTGFGDDIKGFVHGSEFVFNSRAVSTLGLGRLERMHQAAQAGIVATGGGRDPQQIQLLVYAQDGIAAELAAKDYKNNGTLRQIIRADILGQGS